MLETRLKNKKKVSAWNTIKIKNGITYLFPQTIRKNFFTSDSFCFKDGKFPRKCIFLFLNYFWCLGLIRKHEKWKLFVKSESIQFAGQTMLNIFQNARKYSFSSVFVVCQVICHIYGNFVQKIVYIFNGSTEWYTLVYLGSHKKSIRINLNCVVGNISFKTTSRTKIGTKSNLIWKILFS